MENLNQLQEKLARIEKENKELKQEIDSLSDFVEHASVSMHRVGENGIILWANQMELDMLGYEKEEYIGSHIRNFHVDPLAADNLLIQLSNNETIRDYVAKMIAKNGSVKHVLINSTGWVQNGKFIHSRCITTDITPIVEEEKRKKDLLGNIEESEARLRMAIESTGLGTWDWDPRSGVLIWSRENKHIYGLPEDASVTFDDFIKNIYPDDKERVLNEIQSAMNKNSNYSLTFRIIRFDDQSIKWLRVHGQVKFNTEGIAERFIGTSLDVTESKLFQENITRSEKLFRTIALNIPKSLLIVMDKNHRFVTIEGNIMEEMGYGNKDYAGKHPTEVLPAGQYEASKHLYDRVLSGEKFSIENKAATGEDYMLHFIPLLNEKEEVDAGLIIAMDITDIKQAEEKSGKLAAIVATSDDAIISKTLEGVITSWNNSAERTFGYTSDEMIGQPILKLIPEDRKEEEVQILSRLRRGERVEHFETKRLTKNGNLIDVSLTISPVKDAQGHIIGLSKIARDITEKKQEEQRKNDFVAMVSHELKTPLTTITAYIQLLAEKAKASSDVFSLNALSRSELQAKKMAYMIRDFLSLAKLEDAKIQVNKENFELATLIEETANDPQFHTTKHVIQLDCKQKAMVHADKDKIGQVLINLITNAIKYSPDGGNITIGYSVKGNKAEIYVKDQGIGIEPMHQAKLFDRFYRVSNENMKTASGFGIGLYLVAEILRYHNTEVKVSSKLGTGSVFYFTLELLTA